MKNDMKQKSWVSIRRVSEVEQASQIQKIGFVKQLHPDTI